MTGSTVFLRSKRSHVRIVPGALKRTALFAEKRLVKHFRPSLRVFCACHKKTAWWTLWVVL